MTVTFEKALDGAVKYINSEIIPGMNDWQEIAVRIAIGRIYENLESAKTTLASNGIVRAFGIMDADGNIDIDRLAAEVKKEVERKTKMQISIPGFGKFTFMPGDVDKLRKLITEG